MVLTTFLSGEGGLRTCMVTATRVLTLYFTSFITAAEVDHFPVREEGEDVRLSEAADQVYAPDLAALLEEAERLYGEGSFALAHQQYLQVMGHDLPAELELETAFRLADTRWRSRGASRPADASSLEAARKTLENLLKRVNELETLPLHMALEINESLGDSWWVYEHLRNWGRAWKFYTRALDGWAGSKDLDRARSRYLAIVWKASEPPGHRPFYSYGFFGNYLPLAVLENALQIAVEPSDQARAHFLIAMTLSFQGGRSQQLTRVSEEFSAALEMGENSRWYDDALFHFAQWASNSGHIRYDDDGNLQLEPDYERALTFYHVLRNKYSEGETRYYEPARMAIEQITRPDLSVTVSHVFVPGSEVEFNLRWRNLDVIDIDVFAVDLVRDPQFSGSQVSPWEWIQAVNLEEREPTATMRRDDRPERRHYQVNVDIRFKRELPSGAYVVRARGGDQEARDLVLISDAVLVLKSTDEQALTYFCDAVSGEPIAEAQVVVWERFQEDREHRWQRFERPTGVDGQASFSFEERAGNRQYFAAARWEGRQAFALSGRNWQYQREAIVWRVYAYTDRPVYRPDETVNWKAIARQDDGSVYTVPIDESLSYVIEDPKGKKVDQGTLVPNAFGSMWGSLDLSADFALGPYRIRFAGEGSDRWTGPVALFRLEEFKLPEFQVSVALEGESEGGGLYQMGDSIVVGVTAEYYSGGAVPEADVEMVVYQRPFHFWFRSQKAYDWYYPAVLQGTRWGIRGRGAVIHRSELRTDSTGSVSFTFSTPGYSDVDYEYTIEARVRDASRREVVTVQRAKVTRQSYFVSLEPERTLYQPGDRVKVTVLAQDANGRPVSVRGRLKLSRETWQEVWEDQRGREITGEKLTDLKRRSSSWFTFGASPEDYRLKNQGYETEEIVLDQIQTNNEGRGVFTVEAPEPGYFKLAWLSRDKDGHPIKADAAFWTAEDASRDIGFRPGGVSIIVDRNTFETGQEGIVMLTTPVSGRYVLFTTGADSLFSHEVVHLEGNSRLLRIPIDETHVPNTYFEALMVMGHQLFLDQEEIVVPPTENFLHVEVSPDAHGYEPREEGVITVRVSDRNREPVSAELSLALVDAAIYTIEDDFAGDIRQFFFGERRAYHIQNTSTFSQKPYFNLRVRDDARDEFQEVDEAEVRYESDAALRRATLAKMDAGEGFAPGEPMDGISREQAPVVAADASLPGAPKGPEIVVRSDFRNTVLWLPSVLTDENGMARTAFTFPDSLTTWRATAKAVGQVNLFGVGDDEVQTRLPLIARLQAPRFMVARDDVTISGVVSNHTSQPMSVEAALESDGVTIEGVINEARGLLKGNSTEVIIPAQGQMRVDWKVSIERPGEARFKLIVEGERYSDAMEKLYPVYEHGIEQFVGLSGRLTAREATMVLDLPEERIANSTQLTVQVSPSIALTMLDALPYLIDYPYGCSEQTLNRFLPVVAVFHTLRNLGISPEDLQRRVFGGVEAEHAGRTHPGGKRSLDRLDRMVAAGLAKLYGFQHASGAWGWWKDGEDDLFMTAYVVWGLSLAESVGIEVEKRRLQQARKFLEIHLVDAEEEDDLRIWMLHALASRYLNDPEMRPQRFEARAFLELINKRSRLNAYGRALLTLCAFYYGFEEDAQMLARNLRDGVKRDRNPGQSVIVKDGKSQGIGFETAHWGEDGIFSRWSEGGVEATAFALMALLAVDPEADLVEPVVTWLVRNRRGAQWKNTRDSSIVLLALNQYLRVSGRLTTPIEYRVQVNGKQIAERKIEGKKLLDEPNSWQIDPRFHRDGENAIRLLRKSGKGELYYSIYAEYFNREEPIKAKGNEVFLDRQFLRIKSVPTLLKGFVEEKEQLRDGDAVESGDRVEVVLLIESKNALEYMLFEDLKPAGFEALQLRSGDLIWARELRKEFLPRLLDDESEETSSDRGERYSGRRQRVHQELRDRMITSFMSKLPEGFWEIRYQLRAEVPGEFHALPVSGQAMYVPEIRANGSEIKILVRDRG